MADLNALIAQGAQFKQPESPLNMMAQLQTFQQGQSANQLNQMSIAEKQRGMEEANALRRLDPTSASYLQDVMKISPKEGFAFAKLQREAQNAGTEGQIKDVKLLTDKLSMLPQAYQLADTPEAYLALHQSVHADPVVGKWLKSIGATPEKGLAALQNAVQTGTFDDFRMKSMQSVSQLLEGAKPVVVGASSSVYDPKTGMFKQAPAAPEKPAAPPAPPVSIAEYERAKTDPAFMTFLQNRAAAQRAPRPEAAPRTQQVTLSDGSIGIINMDTGAITSATLGGAGVKGKDSTKTAVSEQQAAYNIGRVLTAANEIKNISNTDPSSVQPGAAEALAASVGMGGTANLARSANRQIVQGAQRDALDALLYLATGAAYNKEQLQGQMEAYIPAYTDKPPQLAAKKTRMTELIKSAKIRAGNAWTPEMDTALKSLMAPADAATPAAGGATGEWKVVK
jgi:hypothetical protein